MQTNVTEVIMRCEVQASKVTATLCVNKICNECQNSRFICGYIEGKCGQVQGMNENAAAKCNAT